VQGLVHLLGLSQRSLQLALLVDVLGPGVACKNSKVGLQQMGNAPKITRRDFFWGNAIALPWWHA
jgi:hypothetical protein